MAAIPYVASTESGAHTTTSTSYTNTSAEGTLPSIASGSFTVGRKYFIWAQGQVKGGNNSRDCGMRVVHGSTAFSIGEMNNQHYSNSFYKSFQFFTVWTALSTEGIEMQFKIDANTITADNTRLVAVEISEVLTENTDWFYNEVISQHDLSTTWSSSANNAKKTWTPAATGNWLIFGLAQISGQDAAYECLSRMNGTGTSSFTLPLHQQEGEDETNGLQLHFMQRPMSLTAVEQVIEIESSNENNAAIGNREGSAIFGLRLDAFEVNAIATVSGGTFTTTSGYGDLLRTVSLTTVAASDVFSFASFTSDPDAQRATFVRLQVDDADDPATAQTTKIEDAWDPTDELIQGFMGIATSIAATTSTKADLDAHCENVLQTWSEASAAIFTAELAGAAPVVATAGIVTFEYESLAAAAQALVVETATAGITTFAYQALTPSAQAVVTAGIATFEYAALAPTAANTAQTATAGIATFEYAPLTATAAVEAALTGKVMMVLSHHGRRRRKSGFATRTGAVANPIAVAEITTFEYAPLTPTAANTADTATAGIATFEYAPLTPIAQAGVIGTAGIATLEYGALTPSASTAAETATAGITTFEYAALTPAALNTAQTATAGIATFEYQALGADAGIGVVASAGLATFEYAALTPAALNTAQTATAGIATFEYAPLTATAANVGGGGVTATAGIVTYEYTPLAPTASAPTITATAGLATFECESLAASAGVIVVETATAGINTFEYQALAPSAVVGIVGVAGIPTFEYAPLTPTAQAGTTADANIVTFEYEALTAAAQAISFETATAGLATFEYQALTASAVPPAATEATAGIAEFAYQVLQINTEIAQAEAGIAPLEYAALTPTINSFKAGGESITIPRGYT